jgi:hypothetical protein
VHHSWSQPASASKAKQSKHQAPTGYPRVIPVVSLALSLESSSSRSASPHRQNHCQCQPSHQIAHQPANNTPHTPKHSANANTNTNTAPLATAATPHAREYIALHAHTETPRRCNNNGRRRARYAVLSTTYRCPPAPAHSPSQCVKMPNQPTQALLQLLFHTCRSRPSPTTLVSSRLSHFTLFDLPKSPPHCPPRVRPPSTASTSTDILEPCRGPAPFAKHCCPRDRLSIRQPVLQQSLP